MILVLEDQQLYILKSALNIKIDAMLVDRESRQNEIDAAKLLLRKIEKSLNRASTKYTKGKEL